MLVLLTNRLTIELSFAGAALAAIYPFTKRYTYLPQVELGAAFGWSIPMAFAAVSGTVPPVGWLLFIGNILWSVIYDTEYAMVDRDDDLQVGAKSTAILFGDADVAILGVLMGTFLLAMLFVGQRAGPGLAVLARPAGGGRPVRLPAVADPRPPPRRLPRRLPPQQLGGPGGVSASCWRWR